MSTFKKGLLAIFLFINFYSLAQVGFGIQAGFQQSIPLAMRDSFIGKPGLSGAINIYIPVKNKLNLSAGLTYRGMALNHKIESSGLSWQTLGLNLGNEWNHSKFTSTTFYTGISANYIFSFGENSLSGPTGSGIVYKALNSNQKIVPAVELGMTFKPRKFINFKISGIQTFPQMISDGKPTLPWALNFSIEYRLTTHDIKNWKRDTSAGPEKIFSKSLKSGTLYFIEDGTDSSQQVFRRMIAEHYDYSKVNFIRGNYLRQTLDSFANSPDSSLIFIVKTGNIVYNLEWASTLGLIVYNYKMQNPIADNPLFVRTLAGDSYLEDPLVVKKLIKTLNNRLYKIYNMYRN